MEISKMKYYSSYHCSSQVKKLTEDIGIIFSGHAYLKKHVYIKMKNETTSLSMCTIQTFKCLKIRVHS